MQDGRGALMEGRGLFDLEGHVAVVTGGSRGIGLGYAKGLARHGACVAIWARDQDRINDAVGQLHELGAKAEGFVCEVSEEDQVVAQTQATIERFGKIDSLFANAGVGVPSRFVDMSVDLWNQVMAVNLVGPFLCFREAAKHMIDRGEGGKLIATASIGANFGSPMQEHYSASKAGVMALVRGLSVELARYDIQANAILPGWIETDMTTGARSWEKFDQAVLHRTPARRWGGPADLEAVAVYLASASSRFHTGDVLVVDGGYSIF